MTMSPRDGLEASGAVAGQVLNGKLRLSDWPGGVVARPRLLSLLDHGLHRGVVLVQGPAGTGKSTLVAQWLAATDRRAAVIRLDGWDDDPTRFWTHVVAAVLAGLGRALAKPGGPAERRLDRRGPAARRDRTAARPPLVLVGGAGHGRGPGPLRDGDEQRGDAGALDGRAPAGQARAATPAQAASNHPRQLAPPGRRRLGGAGAGLRHLESGADAVYWIRAGTIQAAAAFAIDSGAEAANVMVSILEVARKGGFVRSVLDWAPSVDRLLDACLRRWSRPAGCPAPPTIEYARQLLMRVRPSAEGALATPARPTLSAREPAVLRLLAAGLANKDIGARLGIGLPTVKNHVDGVYRKLGVRSRTQALAAAVRLGLVRL